MTRIINVYGREILDSRGNPTLETEVHLQCGAIGLAAVPSGASTGAHEAVELRDKDKKRYNGLGVKQAVANVNTVLSEVACQFEATQQAALDQALIAADGTSNKGRLGANAILAVSLATANAAAQAMMQPLYAYLGGVGALTLPVPMCNLLNGGRHADNGMDWQECMIMPAGAPDFPEALRWAAEIFHALKSVLKSRNLSTGVGDEGGFAPVLSANEAALDLLEDAIRQAGLEPGRDVFLAIDAAASEFAKDGKYYLSAEKASLTPDELIERWATVISRHPIASLEDPLAEDDWTAWSRLTQRLGDKIQIVGDDLFVTNPLRLSKGIKEHSANGLLVKMNQIGTVSETIQATEMAKRAGFGVIISHRSGETPDTALADLAVALNTGQVKTGSLCRAERVAKYNRLLKISEELGSAARYAGRAILRGTYAVS